VPPHRRSGRQGMPVVGNVRETVGIFILVLPLQRNRRFPPAFCHGWRESARRKTATAWRQKSGGNVTYPQATIRILVHSCVRARLDAAECLLAPHILETPDGLSSLLRSEESFSAKQKVAMRLDKIRFDESALRCARPPQPVALFL